MQSWTEPAARSNTPAVNGASQLRTTVGYGPDAAPVTVVTPTGKGAATRHTKAVQLTLTEMHDAYRAGIGIPPKKVKWTALRSAYDPKPVILATRPDTTARAGFGWQRWQEPDGTMRYGIASNSRPYGLHTHDDWTFTTARVVVPADGGDAFAIGRTGTDTRAPWHRIDGVPMVPALCQDAMFELDASAPAPDAAPELRPAEPEAAPPMTLAEPLAEPLTEVFAELLAELFAELFAEPLASDGSAV